MRRSHAARSEVEASLAVCLAVWLGYVVREVVHPLELERRLGIPPR